MQRRIGRRRADVAAVTGRGIGIRAVAFLPAALGPAVIPTGGYLYLAVIGNLLGIVVLVVFGIWGFRIGSGGRDGGGGGGSKRRGVGPPPPSGGRELADDFAAWEQESGTPQDEPAMAGRD